MLFLLLLLFFKIKVKFFFNIKYTPENIVGGESFLNQTAPAFIMSSMLYMVTHYPDERNILILQRKLVISLVEQVSMGD